MQKMAPFVFIWRHLALVTFTIQFPNHFLEDLKKLVGEDHL